MIGALFYINFKLDVIDGKDIVFFVVLTSFVIFYFFLYGFINKKL